MTVTKVKVIFLPWIFEDRKLSKKVDEDQIFKDFSAKIFF